MLATETIAAVAVAEATSLVLGGPSSTHDCFQSACSSYGDFTVAKISLNDMCDPIHLLVGPGQRTSLMAQQKAALKHV